VTGARTPTPPITLRPAVPSDAAAIGAVFDAAVRAGWAYLGDLAAEPLFTPQDWDQLVAAALAERRSRMPIGVTGSSCGVAYRS
jgi:hypothetical protein